MEQANQLAVGYFIKTIFFVCLSKNVRHAALKQTKQTLHVDNA